MLIDQFWWLVNSYFNSWWLVKEAFLRWWMMMQDILVTYDSGWWRSSQFLVIGELTNLILVNGEFNGVYTPPPPPNKGAGKSFTHLYIYCSMLTWSISDNFSTHVILNNGDADLLYIVPVMALISFLWATSNLLRCLL